MSNDPGTHSVIKMHRAVDELIFEVNVLGPRCEPLGDLGEGKVVGCYEANRAAIDEPSNDRSRSENPVVRVRPVEDFIEQKKQRLWTTREVELAV